MHVSTAVVVIAAAVTELRCLAAAEVLLRGFEILSLVLGRRKHVSDLPRVFNPILDRSPDDQVDRGIPIDSETFCAAPISISHPGISIVLNGSTAVASLPSICRPQDALS